MVELPGMDVCECVLLCRGYSSSSSSSLSNNGEAENAASEVGSQVRAEVVEQHGSVKGVVSDGGRHAKRRKGANEGGEARPPYELDGFARFELVNLSEIQVCCTDECWLPQRHSHTVCFRRRRCCGR
jgi:hypothetical protein